MLARTGVGVGDAEADEAAAAVEPLEPGAGIEGIDHEGLPG